MTRMNKQKPGWYHFEFHHGPGHQSTTEWYEWGTGFDADEYDDATEWLNDKFIGRHGCDSNWTGGCKRVRYIPTEALDELIDEIEGGIKHYLAMHKACKKRLPPLKAMMKKRKLSGKELRDRRCRAREKRIHARIKKRLNK